MEKKSLKRITAAVTALIMTSGMTFPSFAEEQGGALAEKQEPGSEYSDPDGENKSSDEAEWKFDEETKTLTVSGTGAAELSVYASNPGWKEKVETAVIENGVTGIGEGFFGGCKNLKSVSIPDSVICIDGAFYDCTSLKTITLPDSIDSLYQDTFAGCTALEEIHLGNQMQVLGYGINLGEFNGCTSLERINLPDSLRSITSGTFNGCTSLKETAIPDHVESIDEGVFKDCTSLAEVTLGSGVYYIHTDAFGNCESLEKIVIPEKVRSIDEKAFAGCKKLKEVTVLSEECIIEDNSFEGCDPSLVIKAYKGSKAEKYAERNGFAFEAVQKKVPTEEEREEEERKSAEEAKERKEAELKRAEEEKKYQKEDLIKSLTDEGMRGDITGDGKINVFDVMRYKKSIIEGNSADLSDKTDINRDGALGGGDVSAVMSDVLGASVLWSYGTMPKMESDTVSGQLESVLKSKMLCIGYSNALKLADESGGSDPIKNLISGNTDLVFADSVSEEQKKAAADAGVKLNIVPVAKEGLIFIVNSSNPVDSLTSEQIKGIFSGKITNWKEVGGNDEVIVPFQRNDNAESQKFMKEWMKGELAEALKIGTVNSEYKNLENAIGFTCYTSAAQMYADSPDIKYLAVDGVKPSADTMNDGTYPVLNSISAVYSDKASQNTGNLAAWIMSEEGQTAVADGGFISVKNTEDPVRTKLYTAKGTGREKPADLVPHWNTQRLYLMSDNYRAFSWDDGMPKSECLLSCLKDKTVQEKINSDISKVMFGDSDVLPGKWGLTAAIFNGYINLTYKEKSGTGKCVKLNYDLRTGDKLEKFSDLFYKDTDFLPLFNRITSRSMAAHSEESFLTDYLGLSDNIRFFDFESVTIFGNGPYTTNDFTLSLHSQYEYEMTGYLVTSEYFDSRDLLEEGTSYKMAVTLTEGSSDEWIDSYSYGKDGKLHYDFISYYHTPEEVEARNHRFDSLHEKVCDLYKKEFPECDDSMLTFSGVRIEDESGNSFYETNVVDATVQGGESLPVRSYHFDPDTDEPIVLSDVFGKDFEKYDGQYWISCFDLRYGTVDLYDEIGRKYGETVNFSLEDTNVKYLQLHDVYAEELSRVRHGYVSSESALVYPESYVVKFNKEKKGEPVGKGVKTEIRNYVYSLGKKWYECWNADNGDYCGWISEDDITVQNTEEENKLYSSLKFTSFEETPISGHLVSIEHPWADGTPVDVICYTNESVMNADSELEGSVVPLDDRYVNARNKCLSHGKWLYECWSGLDYVGWVEMHDFNIVANSPSEHNNYSEKLESERTGTVPGKKYNGIDFYASKYIVEDSLSSKSAGCVCEDIKIKTEKRCEYHGEWWYECVSAEDGEFLGWVNGDLIEFD